MRGEMRQIGLRFLWSWLRRKRLLGYWLNRVLGHALCPLRRKRVLALGHIRGGLVLVGAHFDIDEEPRDM